jgi:nucleotide-binding universal stress UspA family protein
VNGGRAFASLDGMTFHKILCATDFSELSRPALDLALELARPGTTTVTIAHVFRFPWYGIPQEPVVMTVDVIDAVRASARESLGVWKREAERRAPGVGIDTVLLEGTPWEQVVNQAERGGYDLIVAGKHGRTGLARALIGSVAEAIVRHATVPVLVASPAAARHK